MPSCIRTGRIRGGGTGQHAWLAASFGLVAVLLVSLPLGASAAIVSNGSELRYLDTCPRALYRYVPMFNKPIAASYFSNLTNWAGNQIVTYAVDEVLPRSAAAIAFLVVAVLALAIFISWRISRCICRKCCNSWKPDRDPKEVTKGPLIWTFKILAFVLCLGIIAVAVVGFAVLDKRVAITVTSVNSVIEYGQGTVVVRIKALLDAVAGLSPVLSALAAAASSLTSPYNSQLNGYSSSISSATGDISGQLSTDSLNSTLESASDTVNDIYIRVDKYENYGYRVVQALYGLCLAAALLLALFVGLHCPLGIAILIILCLLVTILFFVLGLVLSLGLIGGSDMCLNVEPIAGALVSSDFVPAIGYYSNASMPDYSLEDVLLASVDVNLTDIRLDIDDTAVSAIDSIETVANDPSVPAAEAAQLSGIVADLRTQVNVINVSVGNSTDGDFGVIGSVSYEPIHALYVNTKTVTCCDLMDEFAQVWMCLCAAGWLLIAASVAAMIVLSRLDLMPQNGDCCDASCYHVRGLGRVEDEQQAERDRELAKNVAHPVGPAQVMPHYPYTHPMNGIMQPPGMPMAQPPPPINNVTHNHNYAPPAAEATLGDAPSVGGSSSSSRPKKDWQEQLDGILAKRDDGRIPEIVVPAISVSSPDTLVDADEMDGTRQPANLQ